METSKLDAFQVIADPSRRQMLHLLSQGSMNINSLAGNFEMSRPAVSKHVKVLLEAGFITIESMGRQRYCHLNRDGFNKLQDFINYFDQFWLAKLKNLDTLLKEKNQKT